MSEVPRYFPLQDTGMNATWLSAEGLSLAANRTAGLLPRPAPPLFEPLAVPLGIAAAVSLVTIALLLLLTVWYGREVETFARQLATAARERLERAPGETVEYTYAGIKLVLRRYYLRLREALGCSRCTPRELAERSGRRELESFAKLYEEVVYGSKEAGPESGEILARLDGSL